MTCSVTEHLTLGQRGLARLCAQPLAREDFPGGGVDVLGWFRWNIMFHLTVSSDLGVAHTNCWCDCPRGHARRRVKRFYKPVWKNPADKPAICPKGGRGKGGGGVTPGGGDERLARPDGVSRRASHCGAGYVIAAN